MQKLLWLQSKRMAPLFSLLFLTLLFTACGSVSGTASHSTPTPTPTPVPQPLQKLLADSQSAMSKLSSEHMMITASMKSQGGNTGGNASENTYMTYEADMKKPHQFSVKTSTDTQIKTMDQKYDTVEVIDGDKLYVQNKLGKWYVINDGAASTKSTVANDKFFQLAMQGKITDKGYVMMDGIQVRHITSIISNATPNSLFGLFGSNLTNGAGSKNVTLDFWIDESTHYIHEITMRFPVTTSSSRATMTWDVNVQENMSNFNRPVTITIPAHAIPATSLSEVE